MGLGKGECKEVELRDKGKGYLGMGFGNVGGGFEVGKGFLKGCVGGKEMRDIGEEGEGREKWVVLEGMMEYV